MPLVVWLAGEKELLIRKKHLETTMLLESLRDSLLNKIQTSTLWTRCLIGLGVAGLWVMLRVIMVVYTRCKEKEGIRVLDYCCNKD